MSHFTPPINRSTADWEEIIGEKIRRLRLLFEMNQQELADAANISLGAVRNIETGKGSTLHSLIRIARVLERTDWLESLYPESEPSPSEKWRDIMLKKPRQRASRNRGAHDSKEVQ